MASGSTLPFEERIGQVLRERGFITEQQLSQARDASQASGAGLLDTLVSLQMLAQDTLVTVLSFQLRIPVVDLRHVNIDPEVVRLVPEDIARQYSVLPIGLDTDGSLRIATRMPHNFQLSAELSSVTGRQIKFVLAIGGKPEDLISKAYAPAGSTP